MLELKSFCLNLTRLRNLRGMTQEELADQLGISGRTEQRLESGQVEPTLRVLVKLALIFNLSIDDVVFFDIDESYNYKPLGPDDLNFSQTRKDFVDFTRDFKRHYDQKTPFLNFVADYSPFRDNDLMLTATNLIYTLSNYACIKVLPRNIIMKKILAGSTWKNKNAALTLMNKILKNHTNEIFFQTTELHELEKMTTITLVHYFYKDDQYNIYWFSCIDSFEKQPSH